MISAALGLLLAMGCTALTIPLARRLALRLRMVDEPSARRVHEHSVPRAGGVAIVLGFFAALGTLLVLGTDAARELEAYPRLLIGLLVGGLMVTTLGLFDDIRGVSAKTKLAVQTLAVVAAYAAGFRIEAIDLPFVGAIQLGWLALPVTWLWICGVINALNLIDGLDGLAAGVAFFACVTNFVIAVVAGKVMICLLSAVLGGAILGFLFYNFNPATIFMGDSGSMFLGYVLATISIFGAGSRKGGTAIAIVVPILALGVPIMDMLIAVTRRLIAGRSIMSADRGHIHHRLLDVGLTHRRAVLLLYVLCSLFTFGALALNLGHSWQVGVSLAFLSAALFGLTRFVGYFDMSLARRGRRSRRRTADVERIRRALPDLMRRFDGVVTRAQLLESLQDFAMKAGLAAMELAVDAETSRWQWQLPGLSTRQLRDSVRSSYALENDGSRIGELSFIWDSEFGDVSAQADVLLQLVSDAVELAVEHASAKQRASQPGETPEERRLPAGASTVNS